MTSYHQTTLSEIFGTGTVDTVATARLFAEIYCCFPKRKSSTYKKEVRR